MTTERGLNVDMLDVDRLRDWARLLLTHGADVSHWASVPHLAGRMQTLATQLEKEIRDVGELRANAAVANELLARVQNYLGNGGFFNPELMEHDKVRALVMDLAAALSAAQVSA